MYSQKHQVLRQRFKWPMTVWMPAFAVPAAVKWETRWRSSSINKSTLIFSKSVLNMGHQHYRLVSSLLSDIPLEQFPLFNGVEKQVTP